MQTYRSKHRHIAFLYWLFVGLLLISISISAWLQSPAQAAPTALLGEDFEELTGSLQTAVDENISTSILGWTHTTPQGWTIDNSNMPAIQGVTEWQGWSFTTSPFWTAADLQGRESFNAASGVFAVADPDEWDDLNNASASGNFDSTLVSPAISVAGGQTTFLSFYTHYRQEGNQTADITVSFDGGAEQLVLRYDGNANSDNAGGDVLNAFVNIPLPAPTTTSDMVVKFRMYNAGNNWFWAVDDVGVTTEPASPPTATPAPTLPPTILSNKRVLYIGVDGLRGDSVIPANAPNLDEIINNGAFHTNVIAGNNIQDTSSAPGWSTLLTGVWATKHNVYNNGQFGQNNYAQYPHFFTQLKNADAGIKTASVVHWGPINDNIVPAGTDIEETYSTDTAVANRAVDILSGNDAPHVTFLHFDDVDHAGHSCCYAPDNGNYLAAISGVDAHIGAVINAVKNRASFAQEDWLIVVASDHGGSGTSHGGQSSDEQMAFMALQNTGATPYCQGNLSGSLLHVDVLPHVFDFIGLPINPAWGFDGQAHSTCSGLVPPTPTATPTGGVTLIYEDVPTSPIAIPAATVSHECVNSIQRTITVPDNVIISDVNFGFNAAHPWRSDVEVTLQSPAGAAVKLIQRTISTNIDNWDLMLDDASINPLNDGNNDDPNAPFYDRLAQPSNPLNIFNGQNAQGDWTITVCDIGLGDDGDYNRSQLVITTFSTNPTATPEPPTPTTMPGGTTYVFDDAPASPLAIPPATVSLQCVDDLQRTITVNDNLLVDDVNFGFNASHPYRSDVEVTLISPMGTSVKLIQRTASTNIDNWDLMLDDASSNPLNDGNADDPAAPYYDRDAQPSNALTAFDGENAQGNWTIIICDIGIADDGDYNRSQLIITSSSQVPTATLSPTPVPPTNTPAPTATLSPTPVPPTNTPAPTATLSPTPVPPTNTPAPTATLPPTNTPAPTATLSPTPVPPSGAKLAIGAVNNVSSSGWTTVNLGQNYSSMVVVASVNYDSGTVPAVVRIQNAAGSSFEVMVSSTDGVTAVSNLTVHYLVVEEGVYTQTTDGVTMEAVKFTSTVTDENNSWVGESRSYANSYSNPVALGQIMSANDPDWSVFWARGGSRTAPPNSSTLFVGKHVGEDPDNTRADETIGYIVIESGSGAIEGKSYRAALGNDSVKGVDNAPPFSYSLSGLSSASVGIVSAAAMDGNNGGWPILYGANPLSSTSLQLAFDEDQAKDSERKHTAEQVAFIVFE